MLRQVHCHGKKGIRSPRPSRSEFGRSNGTSPSSGRQAQFFGMIWSAGLLGFLPPSNLLLLLFSLLPTGIGVVFLHTFGENVSLLAEILLIHHSI